MMNDLRKQVATELSRYRWTMTLPEDGVVHLDAWSLADMIIEHVGPILLRAMADELREDHPNRKDFCTNCREFWPCRTIAVIDSYVGETP